jgi:hypothetical protein
MNTKTLIGIGVIGVLGIVAISLLKKKPTAPPMTPTAPTPSGNNTATTIIDAFGLLVDIFTKPKTEPLSTTETPQNIWY